MALPTNAEIDAAVPTGGTPSRSLTNAALKNIVGAVGAISGVDQRVLAPWFTSLSSGTAVTLAAIGDSTQPNNQPTFWPTSFFSMRNVTEVYISLSGQTLANFIDPANTGANSLVALKALNPAPKLIRVRYGLNDAKDADINAAYGSAKHIAFATLMRSRFLSLITGARASFPGVPFMVSSSNHLGTGSTHPVAPNTVQNVNDALDLVFRGNAALGVPALESIATGLKVLDTNGSIFNVGITQTATPLMDPDMTHPAPPAGFATWANAEAQLIVPEFNPTRSVTVEAGAAQAQATYSRATLEGDDYKLAYTGVVTVSDSGGWNISVGTGLTDQAMGGAFGQNPGQAGPRGLVPGDLAIWDDDTVDLILVPPTGQQNGDLRYDYFSRAGDWVGRIFGSGNPPKIAGRQFRIYRHKFANSPGARNQFRLKAGTPAQNSLVPRYAYRFWMPEQNNGSCVIQGIGGEFNEINGQTANGHTLLTTDRLYIGGITLSTGLVLTGATIAVESNNTIRVTLAGFDFRGPGNQQGFIFSST